jgi:hypothetical protein
MEKLKKTKTPLRRNVKATGNAEKVLKEMKSIVLTN